MDPYHMQLPGFSESQRLNCSDPLNHDLCSDMRDMMYAGLNSLDMDPSPSATDIAMDTLEDNLDALSLYSVKDCDSAKLLNESDSDSQPSLHELGLLAPPAPKEAEQRGRSNTGSARKGKHQHSSPQSPFLDCSFCGKVFSSASSLSKHCLTHSQERKHVCKVCSKAFKRPDHLSAHMLTHQKTKPFICIEQGCNKSYCDHRSLRRHYEMSQHGLRILKEMPSDEGEMSSKTTLSSFEETFRRTKRHGCDIDYYRWQNHGELNLQDTQKQSVLQDTTSPLFRQFFVKSQETAGNQEEKQVQQHLLQIITKSQHILSPTQVAMDSFSLPCTSSSHVTGEKRKLTIFNRIQGGKIYSLTNAVKEENLLPGCNKTSAGHMDGSKCESGFVCKNCSQLFYTEKGLSSHMCFHSEQWQSPQGRNEQQVHDAENLNPQTLFLKPVSDGNTPSDIKKPLDDGTVVPLVIPVSVPVTATDEQARNKVNNQESQDVQDSSTHQKKRKRQTRSKSLFIPSPMPLCGEMQSSIGGCYQSNLRSPVYLVDHLVRDFFQYSPYTPPPMLSPIREGSGLYFNTVCSSSEKGDPSKLFSTILDRMDGDFGFSLVKDNTKISIEPHINIGSQFQAEIPNLQDRSVLENDEHRASLVWKPWGNIATNQETQDRVTELLNVACSSAMPGGGTNLELALHCLHEAQGNILKAVEMLLFGGPQKPASHPLADYHYTGSDVWMPVEKQLFRKAFCLHKKDFYLIQQKTACSPWKRHGPLPKHNMNIKPKNYRKAPNDAYSPAFSLKGTPAQPGSTDCQGVFPCKECERVFDKVKSRNAHMKRHRPQEHVEPLVKSKWPIKQVRNEPELEETRVLTSSNGNWEIVVSE
ncbi:zinc finger protein 541 isoform B [Alligator mississippiensis]|uniref:Zinc finger protein 541 isoform B n=1 Tax=Alligator mississippiensis TaxID=8496 RepID=A0A151P3V2_ALLMI|nr:zinc finger protein 541 isoform B [Alligator mississippiensis]